MEGVIRAPAGKEEADWSRELEFETHSMKGGLLPHACFVAEIQFHIFAPSTLRTNHRRWKNGKLL